MAVWEAVESATWSPDLNSRRVCGARKRSLSACARRPFAPRRRPDRLAPRPTTPEPPERRDLAQPPYLSNISTETHCRHSARSFTPRAMYRIYSDDSVGLLFKSTIPLTSSALYNDNPWALCLFIDFSLDNDIILYKIKDVT